MPIGIFEQGSRSEPLPCLFRGDICVFSSQVSTLFRYFQENHCKKTCLERKRKAASSRSPPHKIIFILEKYDTTATTIISACTGRTKHILEDGKNGYATVAMTKYYDETEEPTFIFTLNNILPSFHYRARALSLKIKYIFKFLVKSYAQNQCKFCSRVELPCFDRAYGVS